MSCSGTRSSSLYASSLWHCVVNTNHFVLLQSFALADEIALRIRHARFSGVSTARHAGYVWYAGQSEQSGAPESLIAQSIWRCHAASAALADTEKIVKTTSETSGTRQR